MKKLRFDPASASPLFEVTWEIDRRSRMNPRNVTELLREQVPVLNFVRWEVTSIEPGATISRLPLNAESTNQHFTHQAALYLLSGDYTGGTALASLLMGWPVVGVHPVESPKSVSMWLLKGEIKYMKPSVADLIASCHIDDERHDRIRGRFLDGKAVIESIPIYFHNGDQLVGEAVLTYFARQSEKLRAEGIGAERVNSLYELKLTSSAEMIAGIRARESGGLFQDPYAEKMAGPHGMALANRFCERSPQLGGMVAARTRHLDSAILNFLDAGGRDIVFVGVGWDMRPFRLPLPPGTRVFELDFPTTLAERRRRIAEFGVLTPPDITRVEVPIDVRTMPLAVTLADWLDAERPIFIAWEGMSMYLQEDEVRAILDGMRRALQHADSLLWVDLVHRAAVLRPEEFPESVRNFMRGMRILGEPFTFGTDSAAKLMRTAGLRCLESVPSDTYLQDENDPVYSIYEFCLAGPKTATRRVPASFRSVRTIRPPKSRLRTNPLQSMRSNGQNGVPMSSAESNLSTEGT